MAFTAEEVEAHALFSLADQVKDRVEALADDSSDLDVGVFNRLRALVDLMISRIQNSDAILIPINALTQATPHIQNTVNEINAFLNNKNEGHIHNAITQISAALQLYPTTFRIDDNGDYSSALTALSKKSQTLISELEENSHGLSEQLDELDVEVTQIRNAIDAEQTRISDGLGNVETQFTASQGSRSKAFNDALDGFSESLRVQLTDAETRLSEFTKQNKKSFEARANELLEILNKLQLDSEEKHLGILNTYDLVGRNSQIGGYKENAEKAREAGLNWDRIAFGFMIFAILVLVGPSIASYLREGYSPIDWVQILSRFPISTILLVPAAYAGAQSRRHKRAYDTAKRNQLHIAALDPYLVTLPEETRNRIKAFLAPRFFYSDNAETLDIEKLFAHVGVPSLDEHS